MDRYLFDWLCPVNHRGYIGATELLEEEKKSLEKKPRKVVGVKEEFRMEDKKGRGKRRV